MAHAVSIVATSATPTAVIRETTTWERFPTLWGELLDEVWGWVHGAGVQAGRNVMLYLDDVPTVEVGVELEGTLTVASGRIVTSALPRAAPRRRWPAALRHGRAWRRRTPRSSPGPEPTATSSPGRAGRSTTTGATTRTRSRPRSTGCSPRDALTSLGPLACCGRVLSADHAPQTPQVPSEAVSAATRPSTVFARPGTTARVAIRERLLPSRPQLLRRVGARLLSAGVSRHRGLPPPWRANGCAGASLERQEAALGATGRQPTCAAASTPKRKRRPGRRRPPSCIDRSNQRLPPAECSRQACCCDPRCR
jgi:hypothetical protein